MAFAMGCPTAGQAEPPGCAPAARVTATTLREAHNDNKVFFYGPCTLSCDLVCFYACGRHCSLCQSCGFECYMKVANFLLTRENTTYKVCANHIWYKIPAMQSCCFCLPERSLLMFLAFYHVGERRWPSIMQCRGPSAGFPSLVTRLLPVRTRFLGCPPPGPLCMNGRRVGINRCGVEHASVVRCKPRQPHRPRVRCGRPSGRLSSVGRGEVAVG